MTEYHDLINHLAGLFKQNSLYRKLLWYLRSLTYFHFLKPLVFEVQSYFVRALLF